MERGSGIATRRAGVAGDGERTQGPFRLEPPRRRVQVPQLLVAVLLVTSSALAAVVLFSRAAARDPVLALAADLQRGQLVAAADFRVVYVGSDDPISTVPADGLASLVGLVAVTDLETGTVVTRAHFVARAALGPGEGVVGLALSAGEYPTLRLAPGDLVDVISTAAGAEPTGVVVSGAEVFDLAVLGSQGQRFISLRMPAEAAAQVAREAAAGGIRLVLVSGAGR